MNLRHKWTRRVLRCAGNAPVTKALCAVTVSSSILLQAARAARRPVPAHVAAFEQLFVFRHPGELLFGAGLLYYSRLFERQVTSPAASDWAAGSPKSQVTLGRCCT